MKSVKEYYGSEEYDNRLRRSEVDKYNGWSLPSLSKKDTLVVMADMMGAYSELELRYNKLEEDYIAIKHMVDETPPPETTESVPVPTPAPAKTTLPIPHNISVVDALTQEPVVINTGLNHDYSDWQDRYV